MTRLADRMIARREALNLTRQQCADAAGMHPDNWSRLESGVRPNPRGDTLLRIARALNCTVEDLIG